MKHTQSKKTALASLALALALPAAAQTTLRVPADYPTIQAAINAAVAGDTVLVSPGSYPERLNYDGKAITVISEGGPAATVIDGGNSGNVLVFDSGEGPAARLEGFTIKNGRASFGAGIDILAASPSIVGNIFDTNTQTAGGYGAAIGGNGSSALIERNIFRNNSCDSQHLSGVITFVNGSSPDIVNNLIVDNPCRAITITLPSGNSPQVSNNTIVGNRTGIKVSAQVNSTLHLYQNNILAGNAVGFEITNGSAANNPLFKNNLVFNNTSNYVGVTDQTGINGNLSADPLFVAPAAGNYHITAGSPAVDAGATADFLPETDIDGEKRVIDGNGDGVHSVDIGADELKVLYPPVADFTLAATELKVVFTDTSTDRDGAIASHLWDFGDGSQSTEMHPEHTYPASGTYTVTLTVTDNDGASHSVSKQVAVSGKTFFENAGDYPILDLRSVESPIVVSGVSGNAPATLKVAVDIKHTFIGDLRVDLVAPDGTRYTLHNRSGGSADNIIKTYTVNASSEAANGTWKLLVNDNARADVGKVDLWSLQF
ncbi:leupeptin-inactivating enzyme 1 [Lysobacter antibioticus]|uniref:proprotein convertase P-domain-containing protein n=1 Tax=Lysobacter antibioticus TaxID=84531 RepID=UPI00071728D5|nr:proprotein convertase P-domain-containing protein [Lysobacter antibioticus]ALN60952.1 leupeptin-inactivating enzyme 1 [Lysobacter antibioticus]